jgi:hypothetical protein
VVGDPPEARGNGSQTNVRGVVSAPSQLPSPGGAHFSGIAASRGAPGCQDFRNFLRNQLANLTRTRPDPERPNLGPVLVGARRPPGNRVDYLAFFAAPPAFAARAAALRSLIA